MMYIIHGNTLHCFWKVQITKNEFLKNVQFCILPGLCGSDQQYDFSYSLCYLTWNQQYHKNIICLLILRKILFDSSVLANAEYKKKWHVLDFLLTHESQLWKALGISFIYYFGRKYFIIAEWSACLCPHRTVFSTSVWADIQGIDHLAMDVCFRGPDEESSGSVSTFHSHVFPVIILVQQRFFFFFFCKS